MPSKDLLPKNKKVLRRCLRNELKSSERRRVEEEESSVGNSNTAVIQPCIGGLNTDSLYSDTVYFWRSTRLQIQYNTASRPYYYPVLKWAF
jgi:hypothetical protein